MAIKAQSFYITGGTLPADATSYVERQADRDLLVGLLSGEYCYVLNTRQMGKSSLMVRTAVKLREEGVTVAILDLTAIGQNLTPEQWYDGLQVSLAEQLDLEEQLEAFWNDNRHLGPLQRFLGAIQKVILPKTTGSIVLFVDEIDAVRSLPFPADEFFAGIRALYNARTESQDASRITFCLLGVATPAELISDTRMSPFNVGRRIQITDFTPEEAKPLAAELPGGESTLARILWWSGGNPYMTQRLCESVARTGGSADVDRICESLFLTKAAQDSDDNLAFVRNRLLRSETDLASLLDLYQKVRTGKRVPDDETNPLCGILKLSGVAKEEGGLLKVRNRIYDRVFDREWVRSHMPDAELRRQKQAFLSGMIRSVTVSAGIVAVMAVLLLAAIRSAREAKDNADRAATQEGHTKVALKGRESALKEAQKQGAIALAAKALADRNAGAATQKAVEARLAAQNAARQTRIAEKASLSEAAAKNDALQKARLAQKAETEAVSQAAVAKRLAFESYAANMRIATAAWDDDNVTLSTLLIDAHRTQPRRGFEYGYLRKVQSQGARIFEGTGNALGVWFSPDGKRMLTTAKGGITERELVSGKLVRTLTSEAIGYQRLACSQDGKWVAAAGTNSFVMLWDYPSGKLVHALKGHIGRALSVAFSPDSRRLASTGDDGMVRLWDVDAGQELRAFRHGTNKTYVAAFSPNGRVLATAGFEGTVTLWNADTCTRIRDLLGHSSMVANAVFTPDSSSLITASIDRTVKVWNTVSGQCVQTREGHRDSAYAVAVSSNGELAASTSFDGTARVWELKSGKEVCRYKSNIGRLVSIAFSKDGNELLIGTETGSVIEWDARAVARNPLVLPSSPGKNACAALSPNGALVATAVDVGPVILWDARTSHETVRIDNRGVQVSSLQFSPSGDRLAICCADKQVHIWNLPLNREVFTVPGVFAIISPDGNRLATGVGKHLKIWDARDGALRQSLQNSRESEFTGAAFSPEGEHIITADNDAEVWDLRTGKQLYVIAFRHYGDVLTVDWSPDGRYVATGGRDSTCLILDARNGQDLKRLTGHTSAVDTVHFSPDSLQVASGSADGTVRLWDVLTGSELLVLKSNNSGVTNVRFSADGSELLTSGGDNAARVWKAMTLAQISAEESEGRDAAERVAMEKRRATEATRRSAAIRFATIRLSIPARNRFCTSEQIDLSRHFNALLTDSWQNPANAGNSLASLPAGLQTLGGTRFDIRGVVQVASGFTDQYAPGFPRQVTGIAIHRTCRRFAFLMGAGWVVADGREIGRFVVHYANGQTRALPIAYGRDVRDWWNSQAATQGSKVIWTGSNESAKGSGVTVRLYKHERENPLPGVPVDSIDFVSTMTNSAPFLLAITIE